MSLQLLVAKLLLFFEYASNVTKKVCHSLLFIAFICIFDIFFVTLQANQHHNHELNCSLGLSIPLLGAMLYVVVEELIPEASQGTHSNLSTIGFAIGFVLMMVLDVVLG